MKKFFSEIFQDIDGGYSAKRTAFLMFALGFMVLSGALLLHGVPASMMELAKGTQDKLVELLKWVGGFIMGEQATKFAPKDKTP